MIWFKRSATTQPEQPAVGHESSDQDGGEDPSEATTDPAALEAPLSPGAEPDEVTVILAPELCSAWRENAVDAEDRWGGRPLFIGGRVERVVRRSHDTLGLLLENGGRLTAIVCEFLDQQRGELAGLEPGAAVVVRGTVRDCRSFEFRVVDCTVEAMKGVQAT